MKNGVKPVPAGCPAITPHLVVRGCDRAIEFYKRAFGAEEVMRSAMPGGQAIMHAELKIGNSRIFLCDEFPGECAARAPEAFGGTPVTINLYVEDVDAVFNRAVEAGARVR